jgi:hypothetical protein
LRRDVVLVGCPFEPPHRLHVIQGYTLALLVADRKITLRVGIAFLGALAHFVE